MDMPTVWPSPSPRPPGRNVETDTPVAWRTEVRPTESFCDRTGGVLTAMNDEQSGAAAVGQTANHKWVAQRRRGSEVSPVSPRF